MQSIDRPYWNVSRVARLLNDVRKEEVWQRRLLRLESLFECKNGFLSLANDRRKKIDFLEAKRKSWQAGKPGSKIRQAVLKAVEKSLGPQWATERVMENLSQIITKFELEISDGRSQFRAVILREGRSDPLVLKTFEFVQSLLGLDEIGKDWGKFSAESLAEAMEDLSKPEPRYAPRFLLDIVARLSDDITSSGEVVECRPEMERYLLFLLWLEKRGEVKRVT